MCVTLVERRHELFLDQCVQCLRVRPVLRALVVRIGAPLDQPAVLPGEALGPPAVADRHVRRAIDGRLHPARAARFHGLAGVVHPHVASLHEKVRDVEVVVVYESDAASELRIERAPENLLQVVLADIVGRMRFASKHDLHGATWCGQNLRQAIGIRENQLGTLIAGESPGESDRERVVVEQRRGGNDPGCAHMLMHPA